MNQEAHHRDAATSLFDMSGGLPIPPLNTATRTLQFQNENINPNPNESMQLSGIRMTQHTNSAIGKSGSLLSVTTSSNHTTLTRALDICNKVNCENECELTFTMVRKCVREEIWNDNKFLTDNSIKKIKFDERSMNNKNILNVLLKRTRKLNLDIYDRLKFWRKYGKEVQKELNTMKSTCTKQIKECLLKGKRYN